MRVAVSARVIDRNVGGNSRYARAIHGGDGQYDSELLRPRGSTSSMSYALHEGIIWPQSSRADVLHFPADTGPASRGRTPIVTTVHGLGYRHIPSVRKPHAQFVWKSRVATAVKVSRKIITVSESSADDLIAEFGIGTDRIAVIPHGVGSQFSPGLVSDDERNELRALGFPDRYMLYVGNLEPRKNLLALIEGAEEAFSRTQTKLVICGAPAWDYAEIVKAMQHSEAVIYAGRLPEQLLVPAYRGTELFCFPSKYEGFGLPVLEAMAVGAPVACTRSGSLREVARDAAFEIPSVSSSDIASTLVEAMRSPDARREVALAGIKRAKAFNWAESLRLHREVFSDVA